MSHRTSALSREILHAFLRNRSFVARKLTKLPNRHIILRIGKNIKENQILVFDYYDLYWVTT